MRMAVVGSRGWANRATLSLVLDGIAAKIPIRLVVSGGARGADSLAEEWAMARGLEVRIYLADWGTYGKSAGFHRNSLLAADCDFVVAFWDGRSRGTLDTLTKAADKVRVVVEEHRVRVLALGDSLVLG